MMNQSNTKRPTVPAAEELLNLYFPVHDHGFVALKDYMGSDQCIEEAARTSYAYGTRKVGDTRGLIRSLMRRRHTSPFEQLEIKLHMAMPIFVARQIVRHRTASLNEMSGRYSLMPLLFYTPTQEQLQAQNKKDKQGREPFAAELAQRVTYDMAIDKWNEQRQVACGNYKWLTEEDVARELARIDLPLSTYTQWYWKIDGNNLLKTLGLRCDLHAQWETRQYFNIVAGIAKRLMPLAFEAWEDYYFYGTSMSRQEMDTLRTMIVAEQEGVLIRPREAPCAERVMSGMSKTEIAEFFNKFKPPEKVNFDLALSTAKQPEFFESMYRKAAEG